jgi:hypothetical protein
MISDVGFLANLSYGPSLGKSASGADVDRRRVRVRRGEPGERAAHARTRSATAAAATRKLGG